MENSALIGVGIIISILGIINISGNINSIHSYNRRKVREEDIPAYGRAVGAGTLIIGVFLIIAGIISFWSETLKKKEITKDSFWYPLPRLYPEL